LNTTGPVGRRLLTASRNARIVRALSGLIRPLHCERFHKTILNEFYQVTFRKKLYGDLDTLQSDLDEWLAYYNNERTHQGKMCCGRTPMETLLDGKRIWAEKNLGQM